MTEAISFKQERIEDIYDLQTLKKYACIKNQHLNDWCMQCMDCVSRFFCKAGKQAIHIMEKETKPKEESEKKSFAVKPVSDAESRKRKEIEDIFSSEDPLKMLLEINTKSKSAAIAQRVVNWRNRYPGLEEQYHMVDKIKFLWRKPYDRMTAQDILDELYPKKEEEKPVAKVDENEMSVEDVLNEFGVDPAVYEKVPEPELKIEPVKFEPIAISTTPNLDELLNRLEKEKKDLCAKMAEIDKQIESVITVKKLITG